MDEERRPFIDHLEELRFRFLFSFATIVFFTIVGYTLHSSLVEILVGPLDASLVYSSPGGALDFILKISLMFGLFCSTPFIFYQILKFISPAVPKKYARNSVLFIIFSVFFLLLGATFAFCVALPSSLYFLSKFGSDNVDPLISTEGYLDFVSIYLLGFGFIFQLPLILFSINYINKLKIRKLLKYSRHFILLSFIFAAVLTPTPDIVNQLIMAVPIILLYFMSIIIIWIFNKNRRGH